MLCIDDKPLHPAHTSVRECGQVDLVACIALRTNRAFVVLCGECVASLLKLARAEAVMVDAADEYTNLYARHGNHHVNENHT